MNLLRHHRQRAAGRGRGERGVAVTEFAIVAPFLALLVAGIVEFGTLWRDNLTVTSATRSAARVVSSAGDSQGADYEGIQSLRAALESLDGITIDAVLIYDAAALDGEPHPDCFDANGDPQGSSLGRCNLYTNSQIESLTFGDFVGCTGPDANFCPLTDREVAQQVGTTNVGVWVRVERDFFTELIPGDGITITDHTVMKVEPEA